VSKHITISPVTRLEGHFAISTDADEVTIKGKKKYRITSAKSEGEMFRGFEKILEGRDPLDAQQITQRICGVCPISHGTASIRAQEMAYGITPNKNGRLIQNLILAANYLQSHIIHFYHLAALDFVDITAILKYSGNNRTLKDLKAWVERALANKEVFPAAPFLPRYEVPYIKDDETNWTLIAHYAAALEMRKLCHEMTAVFGAKVPHSTSMVPGGCTQVPTMERILSYASRLKKVSAFIQEVYLPDLVSVAGAFPQYWEIGKGYGNMMCYGVFPMNDSGRKFIEPGVLINGKWERFDPSLIHEDVAYSWFSSASGRHPSQGETEPSPNKPRAYSWVKAPRYKGQAMEVGPLARVMVNYFSPNNSWIKKEVDGVLASLGIPAEKMYSVLGRHLVRGLESSWIEQQAFRWLDELEIDGPPARDFDIPEKASGYGLTEAPRGALGHCSPRDDDGKPGPIEKALEGVLVEDQKQPIEVARIIRSYDPCLACAVH